MSELMGAWCVQKDGRSCGTVPPLPLMTRSPYNGAYRKLVLAFDVGTTYSGISYSILDPDQVPEIKGVTRFPAQERVGGDSKIPTIIYYDEDGEVRAVGAEAASEAIEERAEDEGWTKAEWFKLHMSPTSMSPKASPDASVPHKIPPLPKGKTVVDLFADFMRYLYDCAKTYIQDTHVSGETLWASIEKRIEYVLTHPNGWEGAQQEQMRKAAILAGLVPNTFEGRARIQFVSEGEASLHFCIQNGLTTQAMKEGDGVLIVDAGGGTIDINAYAQTAASNGTSFAEVATPQCHFQGSVFVTQRAQVFVDNLLCNTKFADDIENIKKSFDKTTKLTFRNSLEPQFIKFGRASDRDPKLNIRAGQLKLLGTQVADFFEPSVSCILQAVQEQRAKAEKTLSVQRTSQEQQENIQKTISSVFLVGGFAASDWLFSQLKSNLGPLGFNVCRPDSHVNKAVADGAVSFHLDHFVSIRVSKFAYGVECSISYDASIKEHKSRSSSVYKSLCGQQLLPRVFDVILDKGVQVSETTEFRESYSRLTRDRSDLQSISSSIQYYRGAVENPKWIDADEDMYSTLCYVHADTSQIAKTLKPVRSYNPSGDGVHYRMSFDIILSFGLTEFKAQIGWMEDGEEKRGPARIVYDTDANTSPRE